MPKLREQRYRLAGGDSKVNCYNLAITRKVASDAGMTPDDQLTVRAEDGKIIVEKENDESQAG